jgi:hypothetical protein
MDVEYFKITKDYWIARWIKRPSTKEIMESKKVIIKKGYDIKIGIERQLVSKILHQFNEKKKNNPQYGDQKIDLEPIATNLELPLPMVKLVLVDKKLVENE